MSKNKSLILFLLLTLTVGFGCAKKPDQELSSAEEALRAAQEAGAQELAPEEYEAAEKLIERARELISQGKYDEARELLSQAKAKAEEAKNKAEFAKQEKNLEELRQGIPQVTGLGIQDIFFDYDRSNITTDARPVLDNNASILRNNANVNVVIEGYCDIRGTDEYNLALGQRRAESAKDYLVRLGISPSKIQAVSRGETTQWAEGTTEEAYQQNRRAHFIPTSASFGGPSS
jgi:peptidoglycan-associated lipoprotein